MIDDKLSTASYAGAAMGVLQQHSAQNAANITSAFTLPSQRAQNATAARSFRVVAISNGYLVYTSRGDVLGEQAVATYVPDLARVGELVVAQMAAAEMDRV